MRAQQLVRGTSHVGNLWSEGPWVLCFQEPPLTQKPSPACLRTDLLSQALGASSAVYLVSRLIQTSGLIRFPPPFIFLLSLQVLPKTCSSPVEPFSTPRGPQALLSDPPASILLESLLATLAAVEVSAFFPPLPPVPPAGAHVPEAIMSTGCESGPNPYEGGNGGSGPGAPQRARAARGGDSQGQANDDMDGNSNGSSGNESHGDSHSSSRSSGNGKDSALLETTESNKR